MTGNNDFQNFIKQSKQQSSEVGVNHSASTISTNGQGRSITANNDKQIIEQLRQQLAEKDQVVNLTKEQLQKQSDKTKQLQNHIDMADGEKNEKAMNDVITGYKDTFKKHYKFNVENGEPIEMDIEMKPLSAVGVSSLQQTVADFTGGKVKFFDSDYQEISEAVNAFQVAAIECPEWLKDPDKIYRLDIPLTIYEDYIDWLQSFRRSHRH